MGRFDSGGWQTGSVGGEGRSGEAQVERRETQGSLMMGIIFCQGKKKNEVTYETQNWANIYKLSQ